MDSIPFHGFEWCIGLATVLLLLHKLYDIFYGPLSHVPGPLVARLSNFWMVKQTLDGRQHEIWAGLHRRYGDVVRIGPSTVLFTGAEAFRTVFAPGNGFDKAREYEALDLLPNVPHLFSVRDGRRHAVMRRRIAKAYSSATVLALEARFDDSLAGLIRSLKEKAGSNEPFDLALLIALFTFDTLGQVGFSQTFNLVESGTDSNGIVHAVQKTTPLLVAFSHVPWLVKLVRSTMFKTVFGQPAGARHLENYVKKMIEGRKGIDGKSGNEMDMLDHILNSQDRGVKISDDEAFVEGELILFAGADTIASTIRIAIFHLLRHPNALHKLRAEIDTHAAAGLLSDPPLYHQLTKLPYLQAALRESLRVFPAASAKFMRSVPKGGATVGGKRLPAGTSVGCNPWVLHHDPDIFGPDADEFLPERWLGSPGRVNRMARYDFSFGMGARECAGKQVALVEVQKTVVQLFRKFDLLVPDLEAPWTLSNYGIVFHKDMWVRIRERE